MDNTAWSPSFIGIGAEKSATTWAWTVLNEHPGIAMSHPKELDYFNDNYGRGREWYRLHFSSDAELCTGEISPLYMDHSAVADRIADDHPEAKILVMLRDPFDRAMSHLFHASQNAYGGTADVTARQLTVLAQADDMYIRRSLYNEALRPFFDRIAPERIGVFFFDQLHTDGHGLARSLYEFVGVDSSFVPEAASSRVNRSQDYRSMTIYRLIRGVSRAARVFPPSAAALEWVNRKTSLRARTLDALMVERGRTEIGFREVFPEQEFRRIAADLLRLRDELHIDVPKAWFETIDAHSPDQIPCVKAVA